MSAAAAACPRCASRGLLLAALAGHVDRSVDRGAGGRARDLLALGDPELADAVAPGRGRAVLEEVGSRAAQERLAATLERSGAWSACLHSEDFPGALAVLGDSSPRALFGAGARSLLGSLDPGRSVTLVGSRRGGAYGRGVAATISRLLAGAGVDVVSGLAMGIDSAAHEGALAGGGRTVAVLGAGPERAYPRSARRLYGEIRAAGLVLSELPPGTPTFRWVFPARNRLMAALSGLTVVVEAAERSGSLITAEMALESGRGVGAVPGPVTSWRSSGANRLLAEGAAVIRDAGDVLDTLLGPGAELPPEQGPRLDERERVALSAIEAGAATADAVCATRDLGFEAACCALAALELGGYVSADATGRYSRTTLSVPGHASTIGG